MILTQHSLKAAVVSCLLKGREPLCVSHDLTGLLMGVLGMGRFCSLPFLIGSRQKRWW